MTRSLSTSFLLAGRNRANDFSQDRLQFFVIDAPYPPSLLGPLEDPPSAVRSNYPLFRLYPPALFLKF